MLVVLVCDGDLIQLMLVFVLNVLGALLSVFNLFVFHGKLLFKDAYLKLRFSF